MNVHFISFRKELDFMSYLAIVSAVHEQKAKNYYLWYFLDETISDKVNYWNKIPQCVKVKKAELDFIPNVYTVEDFINLPANKNVSKEYCLFRLKDIYTWRILADYGGLFLDLDTLSLKDISDHMPKEDKIRIWEHYGFIGMQRIEGFYNNAVVMAKENSTVVELVLKKAIEKICSQQNLDDFDVLGPKFLTEVANEYKSFFDIDNEVGEVDGIDDDKVRDVLDENGYVWDGAKILHLHKQSLGKDIEITPEFVRTSRSPYANFARKYLEGNYTFLDYKRRQKVFHILGLQHLPTNKKHLSCAYTQKVLKLCKMLKMLNHKVYFYGVETSEVEADEIVTVLSMEEFERYIGRRTNENVFYNLAITEAHNIFDARAIAEINKRKQSTDFLLCPYGWGHKRISDGVGLPMTVESGIGYKDTFAQFRVFESYTWMSYVYGATGGDDGRNYDVVIPNYFDVNDFEYSEQKGDFLLYIGRIIHRKGLEIAMQVAEATDNVLYIAGQYCGEDIEMARPHVVYIGFVDVDKRKALLRDAKALLVPTLYMPPFEGVHVEAWFSGTPVITTDWGVFGETVVHGVVGYRCRTFDHFCWAVQNIGNISSRACYEYAVANFSLERVAEMYDEYFDMIYDLVTASGWYERHKERVHMNWLRKYYPKEASI